MGTYYKKVEDYLDRIDSGCWIEVGVDRGEGSTKFLSVLAGARGVDFHGVDMDPDQIARATENLSVDGKLPDHVPSHDGRGCRGLDGCQSGRCPSATGRRHKRVRWSMRAAHTHHHTSHTYHTSHITHPVPAGSGRDK